MVGEPALLFRSCWDSAGAHPITLTLWVAVTGSLTPLPWQPQNLPEAITQRWCSLPNVLLLSFVPSSCLPLKNAHRALPLPVLTLEMEMVELSGKWASRPSCPQSRPSVQQTAATHSFPEDEDGEACQRVGPDPQAQPRPAPRQALLSCSPFCWKPGLCLHGQG